MPSKTLLLCSENSNGPFIFSRFKLIGLVSWGSNQCGTTRGSIYVNVSHYLDWIQNSKLMDAVDDFIENGELPYDKMDNGILHEMFSHLAHLRDV